MGTITRNAANNFTTGGVILPAAINDTSVASLTELENVAAGGAMNLISEQTASASSSVNFTSGIDSSYPIYKFEFINLHPSVDGAKASFNLSTDGTNFNVTKTSTGFYAGHLENDTLTGFGFDSGRAQSTADGYLAGGAVGNGNDESLSGSFFLFSPSSTTFVKHYVIDTNHYNQNPQAQRFFGGGYANTTSAIIGVRFNFDSGNIDSGTIKLYGISGS